MRKKYLLLIIFFSIILNLSPINYFLRSQSTSLEDQIQDTSLNIVEIATYPDLIYVGQLVFINCTVENSGQFKFANIIDVKINASVELGDRELYLGGSIDSLDVGQQKVVSFNLTAVSKGEGKFIIIVSTENIQTVSETVTVNILEENNTTTLDIGFFFMLITCCLIAFVSKKPLKLTKYKLRRRRRKEGKFKI